VRQSDKASTTARAAAGKQSATATSICEHMRGPELVCESESFAHRMHTSALTHTHGVAKRAGQSQDVAHPHELQCCIEISGTIVLQNHKLVELNYN
jgi:hypothetical protein